MGCLTVLLVFLRHFLHGYWWSHHVSGCSEEEGKKFDQINKMFKGTINETFKQPSIEIGKNNDITVCHG